ncbi:hypothetical protein [Pseudofrankia sp. DC12]|uniref:hypothetical protein n=1 Tax=Pseudofrankia sp. DC12 TaxID=683315 RepID=UPI0005F7DF20|nr:hypothetical protein [Pseudofrankia sp. DC12]
MTGQPHRTDRPNPPILGTAGLVDRRDRPGWDRHPGVRSGRQLPVRERVSDRLCRAAGSWGYATFLTGGIAVATALPVLHDGRAGPVAIAGLMLASLALLEVWLVLMVARRAERIAADVALHDLAQARRAGAAAEEMRGEIQHLRSDLARLAANLERSISAPHRGAHR